VQALRGIKNSVIGNKKQKLQYIKLGAVQLVVAVLASPTSDADQLVQAAAALGSFAASDEGLQVVLQHGGIPQLLRVLQSSEDGKVVEASARALKAVCRVSRACPVASMVQMAGRGQHAFPAWRLCANTCHPWLLQSRAAPMRDILATPGVLPRLVCLLRCRASNVADCAAAVLACCCQTAEEQAGVVAAGAVEPLVALLSSQQRSKQVAALEALAAVSRGNAATSAAVLRHGSVVGSLLRAIKQERAPHTRFVAAVCLANLSRNLPPGHSEHSAADLQQSVLPVLVRLLGEAGMAEDVPGALCQLVEHSAELQMAAADADAVAKLAALLRGGGPPPQVVEGALRCLATLCAGREENRRQLVEARVLRQVGVAGRRVGGGAAARPEALAAGLHAAEGGRYPAQVACPRLRRITCAPRLLARRTTLQVAAALSDPRPATRAAACACMRSLSRSTKLLRGQLGDVEVAAPLLALAAGGDPEVAAQAAGTLANMAVDFSAVKEQLLAHDGVARFAALAASPHPALRLHGVWGLSSVAYMAAPEVKQAIAAQLPWARVVALLEDPEPTVRVRGLCARVAGRQGRDAGSPWCVAARHPPPTCLLPTRLAPLPRGGCRRRPCCCCATCSSQRWAAGAAPRARPPRWPAWVGTRGGSRAGAPCRTPA
jgi:hypothetical protein